MDKVLFEKDGRIARITLNRPDVLNAIDDDIPAELADAVQRADVDSAVRVMILSGNGRAFCAGYDLSYYCDREADFCELFAAQRRSPRVGLLVRAKHDRVLGKARPKLFETLGGGAADGRIAVEIAGLTARPKSSRKTARPMRRKRLAQCELRFRRVVLPATIPGGEAVTVSGVHIIETDPPEDEQWHFLNDSASFP